MQNIPGISNSLPTPAAFSAMPKPVGPSHLLVVDDDLISINLITHYLRNNDFVVDTVTDGLKGLEKARSERPDLILLDLCMSQQSGFDVFQRLKCSKATRDIPVVLLSTRTDTHSKVQGFELGAADYVTKPIAETELHVRVMVQLHHRRQRLSLEQKLQAYEELYGPLDEDTEGSPLTDPTRKEIERLYRARQLLRERLADPPSLNELARTLGTNQPRLSRGFRTFFGTSVFGFVHGLRLQRARELLIGTSLPVKTIALQVGYRNTSDLSRIIKERFGMTPTELRERL